MSMKREVNTEASSASATVQDKIPPMRTKNQEIHKEKVIAYKSSLSALSSYQKQGEWKKWHS